jgi:hypothetical protein
VYHERVTSVRVKPPLETLASGSLAQVSVQRRKNPFYAPITDIDTSTPLLRVFGTPSSGFPSRVFGEGKAIL